MGKMLHLMLNEVEPELPKLLRNPDSWKSIFVDYHKPFVERIWMPQGDGRINLHLIHPCSAEESLYHPHPWPSAMRVYGGQYEMGIGYGIEKPPFACVIRSFGELMYEMEDPDSWHYVRPIDEPVMTHMISGTPWLREAPKSTKMLRPLSKDRFEELFEMFRKKWR